jgi:dTMP kinase
MGKLIVLEGTDGSGKSTQMELLATRMEQEGLIFRRLRFPRYEKESSALIRMYLGGEFGSKPSDVGAYAASTFYAVDRFASYAEDWKDFYENGGVLISDRYTTSNAVHQGSKMPVEEREDFFRWLYDLEFGKMKLPRPDLVLRLDMPIALSQTLMRGREAATNTSADIHEKDQAYLMACREAGAHAAEFYGWQNISCAKDGAVRSREDIHEEIFAYVKRCLED